MLPDAILRRTAVVAALLLAAAAVPSGAADTAALERLFEVQDIQRMSTDMIASLEAQHAAQVAQETDEARRNRKQAEHDRLAAFIREQLAWERLKPMAVESYGNELSDAEVNGLLAHYATPVGQVVVRKLQPALLRASLESMQELEAAVGAMIEAKTAPAPAAPWKPSGPREQIASDLAAELMKEDFEERVKGIEADMRAQLEMAGEAAGTDVAGPMEQELKRVATVLRDQVTFDLVRPTVARQLAADLDEKELADLLADSRLPERRAQRAALKRADAAFQARMQSFMRDEMLPAMMKVMRGSPQE